MKRLGLNNSSVKLNSQVSANFGYCLSQSLQLSWFRDSFNLSRRHNEKSIQILVRYGGQRGGVGHQLQRVSLSHIMLAPRCMTPALLKKIQSDVQASVTSDAVKDKLLGLGVQTNWRDGVELAKSVLLESPATAALVQELGLKP